MFAKILGLLVVAVLILAALNFSKIQRLLKVNSMFEADSIVHNFSNMNEVLYSKDLPIQGDPYIWPEAISPLPETVTVAGTEVNLADYLEEVSITALVVIKDGKIVSENYYQGTGREDRRISWSMAKSFLSALFGVALENGDIESVDDPVTKYVPELKDTAYETSTIRNVLNMSSGVKFNEDYYQKDSDINKMGHIAGMVLRNATGKSASDYFIENLWTKIGPGKDAYYLTDGEGVAFVLGGLNLRTRDYALFGQLMLQGGNWQGEQVIPESWVSESTAISANPPTVPDGFDYGYQWWIPENSKGDYMAGGIYGQQIYIDPARNIVIAKNAAHIDFNRISPRDRHYKLEAVDMFRSLADHYSTLAE